MEQADTFQTKSSQVSHKLREGILSGEYAPGERLIRRALMKRYGVSLSIVNEALARLELEGLVENREMYGSRVVSPTAERLVNDLILREAVEHHVAYLLTWKASEPVLNELEEKARKIDQFLNEHPGYETRVRREHLDFHLDMARATGYRSLVEALEKVGLRSFVLFFSSYSGNTESGIPEDHTHRALVTTLRQRDPVLTFEKMRQHMHYGLNEDSVDVLKRDFTGCPQRSD